MKRRRGCGLLLAAVLALSPCAAALAQPSPREANAAPDVRPLPAETTTQHTLELPGRSLHFAATAGAIREFDDKHAPLVDLAFIAYQLDGGDRAKRPVTFVFNGGPGFASAWLQVGAVGPWRIPLGGNATRPSASPEPIPNAETWLDFTDLVFIDPAGTGYSRVVGNNEDAKKQLWSIGGDIVSLSLAIRRWLDRFDRSVSPKFILGESYGGFRGPRLVRELAEHQGVGIAGLVLASPALDLARIGYAMDPFDYVDRLPSMVAAARAAHAEVTRAQLADVEQYARTGYLVDLTAGAQDSEAVERRSRRVAEFTGLDFALVRRHGGLLSNRVFLEELDRTHGRIASDYDATSSSLDPFPYGETRDVPDPVLDALQAPISSAMVAIYATRLNWRPENPYRLYGTGVNRRWDWGHGFGPKPQSLTQMRTALALDPKFTVLIAHGMFDLVTPYFGTQLLLDQIPPASGGDRVRLEVFPGGHMFYTDDGSRAAWREAARALIERR